MPAKPSYQVYLSPEEKQKVLEDSAKAGFTSISDYFRWLAGLPTRREQRDQAKQQAANERKRQEAARILKNKRARNENVV
jgi:hypothetical protein